MDAERRSFLGSAAGAAFGLAALSWSELVDAAAHAHAAASQPAGTAAFGTLTPLQAACVAAIAARIVPSDDLPGATEAGVAYFIDRGLGSFFAGGRADFMTGLAAFEAGVAAAHPAAGGFAALPASAQDALLQAAQKTPFFGFMRFATLCGLLASPAYGGNRDEVGWKLTGFEVAHQFRPPFGHYDRDYPGFVPYAKDGTR